MIEAVLVISTVLGGLAAIWFFWDRLSSTLRSPRQSRDVHAYRVADSTDRHFHDALQLYAQERRIPKDEKYSPDEMIRWVKESRTNPFLRRWRFVDDMVVAVDAGIACGLAHVTYYRFKRKSFISYVVARSCKEPSASTDALFEEVSRLVRRRLPRSLYLIAELDDPRFAGSRPQENLRLARLRLFSRLARMFTRQLCILDVPYLQPCLDPDCGGEEKAMLLVFVPLRRRYDGSIPRSEAKTLVRFVLESVYGDSFITSPIVHKRYKKYVGSLGERILGVLPPLVRLLTLEALQEEVRAQRAPGQVDVPSDDDPAHLPYRPDEADENGVV